MRKQEKRLIPLAEAAAQFGTDDLQAFKRACRRFGVLVITEGIALVDYDEFIIKVDKSAKAKMTSAPKGKKKKSPARQIAILKARVKRYPTLIEVNEQNLRLIQSEKVPDTKYDQYAHKKKVEAQEIKIAQMKENFKRDKAELDRLLNIDWDDSGDDANDGPEPDPVPVSPQK